jgi:hypothetical protein
LAYELTSLKIGFQALSSNLGVQVVFVPEPMPKKRGPYKKRSK